MAAKQQPWLIAYKYRPIEVWPGTRPRRGDITETVELSDVPPWKLLAVQKAKVMAADRGEFERGIGLSRLGDEIITIYWAVQVPIGGLSDEEMELLR